VTLKTVMMLKILFCHLRNKINVKIYTNRKQLLEIVIILFIFFKSNKCSLGENKMLITKKKQKNNNLNISY